MNLTLVRAKKFGPIVSSYSGDELDENLIDLLADAMHWADYSCKDFHKALAQAFWHYIQERNDQPTNERRLS